MSGNDPITQLARWFSTARTVVVLTGAGMLAESGMPAFRDTQGSCRRSL